MLAFYTILLFGLIQSNSYSNSISKVHLDSLIKSQDIYLSFDPICQRILKNKESLVSTQSNCQRLINQFRKSIQKIQFKSNQQLSDLLKKRRSVFANQHTIHNVSRVLQKVSDQYHKVQVHRHDLVTKRYQSFQKKYNRFPTRNATQHNIKHFF